MIAERRKRMSNYIEEYIKRMKDCANGNCDGCTFQYEGLTNTEECKEDLIYDGAELIKELLKRLGIE